MSFTESLFRFKLFLRSHVSRCPFLSLDSGKFLPTYLEKEIFENDPFKSVDEEGVGQLIKIAEEKSRSVKQNIKLGICGEHGGDPATIDFCYRVGLNYVSCSPYRVPIARLAGAQAVIRNN